MPYCMNREELKQFLDFKISCQLIDNNELTHWITAADSWQDELSCLIYLFAQIIDRKNQEEKPCQELIEFLYQLHEQMYLTIQEFDSEFIDNMLRHIRNINLSLEEELVKLQDEISQHQYGKKLRY